jgi:hypothetical protein
VRTARVLLAVAVTVLCIVLMPWRAAADEPVALVSITITSMEPALPTRNGEITVTGRVTNITKDRLNRLEALFWRNQAPILGRAGMQQALASESNDPGFFEISSQPTSPSSPPAPQWASGSGSRFLILNSPPPMVSI